MATVVRPTGIGNATRVAPAAVFPDPTGKASSPIASGGVRAWSRLTFAGAAVSGVAGRSLAGRCAMPQPSGWSSFPALIRLPVEADGKPNLVMGLPWRP